jgi:hypothetical protein
MIGPQEASLLTVTKTEGARPLPETVISTTEIDRHEHPDRRLLRLIIIRRRRRHGSPSLEEGHTQQTTNDGEGRLQDHLHYHHRNR